MYRQVQVLTKLEASEVLHRSIGPAAAGYDFPYD